MERHKIDVTNDLKQIGKQEKIQLKSRKLYTLTTNKLDVSIFQFKDRPIFKKREPSPPAYNPAITYERIASSS